MLPETDSFSSEDSVFHHLYEQARLLYNFASLMTTHSNHKNCSELAPTLTMTEVHLLVDIMEQPGIGVSELGRLNLKTRGAISQMVKKLEIRKRTACKDPGSSSDSPWAGNCKRTC